MSKKTAFPWGHERRFNAYSEYIRNLFGGRVQKVSIDAGFTCPNRDGYIGSGGCTFCNNRAFNPSYCEPEKSVKQQIHEGMGFHNKRYRKAIGYLAYFQAYSNTYAPLEILKKRYEEALGIEGIKGLIIGTRPDCIDDEILDYLAGLSESYYVTLEFGIESCYDNTLERINRGHDFTSTVNALKKCEKRNIRTGGHMIIGLPGETKDEILQEAGILSGLPVNQLKFHQLQIVKGSAMALEYRNNPDAFSFYNLDEYLKLMTEFIESLNPQIVIERIAGETIQGYNLRQNWGLRYDEILRLFELRLEEKNTWQGRKFNP
ncbi:MAG: TIGR01212 family radical SAM protein [Bacteroidota bacterium]